MEVTVDINDVERLVKSPEFAQFLMKNSVNIGTPYFILQTMLDVVQEEKKKNSSKELEEEGKKDE